MITDNPDMFDYIEMLLTTILTKTADIITGLAEGFFDVAADAFLGQNGFDAARILPLALIVIIIFAVVLVLWSDRR